MGFRCVSQVAVALLLAVAALLVSGRSPVVVPAQGGGIACRSMPTAIATPVAGTPEPAGDAEFPAEGGELTVFAAASLTDAFEALADDLEAEHDGLTIAYNFAGSQALVTQLAEGAEADVFASANSAQMDAAVANGSVAVEPQTFVRNRLAIVVPADNPAGLWTPADLAADGLRLVLPQPEVPAGRYARESICLMGQDRATFGEGFVDRVADNIVSEEEDVRNVLTRVRLGEADAGVVYLSDADAAGDEVGLIEIPAAVNVLASYPIAPIDGGDAALAEAFVASVLGADGQATLAAYGFEPVAG